MWHYVFFMAYIDWKDEGEFNGTEQYVADLIESLDVKWFPIDKALCVTENEEDENEVEILKQMKKIEINVSS